MWIFKRLSAGLILMLSLPAVAAGGTPVSDVDVILEKLTPSLIVDPLGGDGIDVVCVSLPKKVTPFGIGIVAPGDAGWVLDTSTPGQMCARRQDAMGARAVIFKLSAAPKPGKYSVTIGGSGEVLFQRKRIQSRNLSPIETITDVLSVLDFPNEVTPGELVLAAVTQPAAAPSGGRWSFSGGINGVVLDPELDRAAHSPAAGAVAEEEEESMEGKEMEEDLGSGSEAEFSEVIVVTGTRAGGPRKGAPPRSSESGSLTGTVLDQEDLDVVSAAIANEHQLVLYVPPNFGVMGSLASTVNTNKGKSGEKEGENKSFSANPPEPVMVRVTYRNRFGQILVDGEAEVRPVPVLSEGDVPVILYGTEMAFAGRQACVCGFFPNPSHWSGLMLDGEPVRVTSATSSAVSFELPSGALSGAHQVTGNPTAGFSKEDLWRIIALELSGSLDQEELFSGGSTIMRLEITGTDEPLALRLRNTTPSVITLDGGDDQVATSSGSQPNTVTRTVGAKGRGSFNIEWSLDTEPCPCEAQRTLHQLSIETIRNIK